MNSFGYIPRSEIAVSFYRPVFSFLRNLSIFFSTMALSIYIPTNVHKCSVFSPHPHEHLSFLDFLVIAILTGVKLKPHRGFGLHFPDDE